MNTDNLNIENFENYFRDISEIIFSYRDNLNQAPLIPSIRYPDLYTSLYEDIPYQGIEIEELLTEIKGKIIPNSSKVGHPLFLAWMNNAGSDAGMLGDLINTGLNQNSFMYKAGPAATVIEDIVVQWMGKLFGFSDGFGGTLVSGGTTANLTSLLVARETKANDTMINGIDTGTKLILYVSEQGHTTIERAVGILGIGTKNIRKIPTDSEFRIDVAALEIQIKEDISYNFQPFFVVAQGGSASIGAVDPIDKVADICKKYNLWLHVDAAYGGAAMLVKEKRQLFQGIEHADSITVDPHKWFYIPTEAGLVLIKNKEKLFDAFTKTSCKAYKGNKAETNFLDYGMQLSRTSRAMKVWFAFKAYGFEKIGKCVEQNIFLANELKNRFKNEPDWEVLNPVDLSIVCLRYLPDSVKDINRINDLQGVILNNLEESGKAFLTPVTVNNKNGIRICFANHRTSLKDLDILYNTLISIAENLKI
jgi:aromatic-L-amino-acid/L-tryptophan decarboxylase